MKTYGSPAWKLFTLLLEEENEEEFWNIVEVFRQTLRLYGQDKLLSYFERQYFVPDRVKQWAKWYRRNMYGCKWLLDNNMHVES